MIHLKAITSFVLAASLFTDPSIVSKYIGLPPDGYVASIMVMVTCQIVFLLSRRGFCIQRNVLSVGIAFFIYAMTSLFYRLVGGQSVGDVSLHVLMISNFFFVLLLLTDAAFQGTFVTAIYVAGTAHFLSLFPDPLGFRDNLVAATAYDFGAGGLSEFLRRETGLFPAPAMLVAFALVLFITAFFNFARGQHKIWSAIFIAISIAIGLATFNRSFLIVMAFTFLILNWCVGVRGKLLILYAVVTATLLMLPLGEYVEFVGSRIFILLDDGLNASQRWTGDTGILTGLNIFLTHPIFGSPIAPSGGILQALGEQQQVVNPHNGLVLILAVYGLIGGAPILSFYWLSLLRASSVLANRWRFRIEHQRMQNPVRSQTYFAIISLSLMLLLMIEPLSEYAFIYLLSISPMIARLPPFSLSRKIRR